MSKRVAQLSPVSPNDRKHRDTAYDGGARLGAPESVYSPQCIIAIKREVAACQCCGKVRDIINGYCSLCRANGANEGQCMNPTAIKKGEAHNGYSVL